MASLPPYNPQWYEQQRQAIEVLGTKNSQKANQKGLPNRDTRRALARREWMRKARYQIQSEGFAIWIRGIFKMKK